MATAITNISDAKASLSRLVERVEKGERIVIGRAGRPVAVLVPWEGATEPRELSSPWRGKVWMADDFDELPDELAEAFGVADRSPE
ncbi:MAG: type II toxin-antitoxin system prevent-host-death family antitoxin [Gammaproteobacteria bacterium]|nr:type II toxin-antitoxin system prevent-host-death family antitoxin [Gammaproteobacteria bacterium]